MWIPETRFYYPHESQVEKFRRPEARELFRNYYRITQGEAASTGIEHFSLQILKDCEACNAKHLASSPKTWSSSPLDRRSESGMFFSDVGSPGRSDRFQQDEDQARRKRHRHGSADSISPASPASVAHLGLFTPSPSDDPADRPDYIKTEDEEQMFADTNSLFKNDIVTIYVGAGSHEHKIPRADLAKSPILTSWLKTDADKPYIMHPNLTGINNQHFASLICFMHKGEYLPRVVNIPTGMNSRCGTAVMRKGLDKLVTSDQYSVQLVRAGHLYKLAELFQVRGFTKYIHHRITETEFSPYNVSAVLDLANIIFSRLSATPPATIENTDSLEAWILTKLGWEFQTIMKKHSSQFFKVVAKTRRSEFFERFLDRKKELVRQAGGEPEQLE